VPTNPTDLNPLVQLWDSLSISNKKKLILLSVFILIVSILDILSIGAIFPFLAILTSPEVILNNKLLLKIINFLRLKNTQEVLFAVTVLFILFSLISASARIALLWLTNQISFKIGADLSSEMYKRTLYQPYDIHCSRNSSEIISGITGKANAITSNNILPALTILSCSITIVFLMLMLLSINPILTFFVFGGFGIIYISIIFLTRKIIIRNSFLISKESVKVVKSLQEGLGGIRDVLIDHSQKVYCDIYHEADKALRQAQGSSSFISASPRYLMESLSLLIVGFLAFNFTKQPGGISHAIPVLGALALSAQRILPMLQQIYSSWIMIQSGRASLYDALNLLNQTLPRYLNSTVSKATSFNRSIKLANIEFRYNSSDAFVLKKFNLTIYKSDRLGIVGTTGCGKSTLLDIIMGLLTPSKGSLIIDGKTLNSNNRHLWQSHIAHVPQSIFLSDSTIKENIAFGIPKNEISIEKVKYAAAKAQLDKTIERWPENYETIIGERGVRLSGGQRQRIGIARALYKNADVIIFDEATSALDIKTEKAIMKTIDNLSPNLTIIIVAHRTSTLKNCKRILDLSTNKIKKVLK
jgi:ATP-binding cassette subfamily B protein